VSALLVALVMLVGVADAAPLLPPGNSAANQYSQTLPGPGGEEQATGRTNHRKPQQVVGKSTAEKLEHLGADGEAALRLTSETAPQGTHPRGHRGSSGKKGSGAGSADSGGSSSGGSSGLGEVLGQASGTETSGGMGVFQPLIILLALVAASGYAVGRRRKGHHGS
jgi:hypothetical protein